MKALTWHGIEDVRVEDVPDPTLLRPTDAIVRVTSNRVGIDRLAALHTAMEAVRRGGTVSVGGVYGGTADPMPMMYAVFQAKDDGCLKVVLEP